MGWVVSAAAISAGWVTAGFCFLPPRRPRRDDPRRRAPSPTTDQPHPLPRVPSLCLHGVSNSADRSAGRPGAGGMPRKSAPVLAFRTGRTRPAPAVRLDYRKANRSVNRQQHATGQGIAAAAAPRTSGAPGASDLLSGAKAAVTMAGLVVAVPLGGPMSALSKIDPAVAEILRAELHRQQHTLELIASENHVSPAVLEATASVLTDKYAEGYPAQAVVLRLRRGRPRRAALPSTGPSNCSGPSTPTSSRTAAPAPTWPCTWPPSSPATRSWACDLDQGGHLSHGLDINFSGICYQVVSYGVRKDTETLDMDAGARAGQEGAPRTARRRRLGLSADDRLRRLRGRSPARSGCLAAGRHRPHRRAGRRRRAPRPGARTAISSPPPRTRPSAARAGRSSSAARNGPGRSTRPSSPASRADR